MFNFRLYMDKDVIKKAVVTALEDMDEKDAMKVLDFAESILIKQGKEVKIMNKQPKVIAISKREEKKARNKQILADYNKLRKQHPDATKSSVVDLIAQKWDMSGMAIKKILTALGCPEFNLQCNPLKHA